MTSGTLHDGDIDRPMRRQDAWAELHSLWYEDEGTSVPGGIGNNEATRYQTRMTSCEEMGRIVDDFGAEP